jgi:hypothetical protein
VSQNRPLNACERSLTFRKGHAFHRYRRDLCCTVHPPTSDGTEGPGGEMVLRGHEVCFGVRERLSRHTGYSRMAGTRRDVSSHLNLFEAAFSPFPCWLSRWSRSAPFNRCGLAGRRCSADANGGIEDKNRTQHRSISQVARKGKSPGETSWLALVWAETLSNCQDYRMSNT